MGRWEEVVKGGILHIEGRDETLGNYDRVSIEAHQ